MKSTNEFDLIDLLALIQTFFKRNYLILLVFLTVGIALGIIKYKNAPKLYKTSFIVKVEGIDPEVIKKITDSYSTFLHTDNIDFPELEIEEIKNGFIKMDSIQVTSELNGMMKFELLLEEKSGDYKKLQENILKLISNNRYIKEDILDNRNMLAVQIDNVNEEIDRIDQMQKIMLDKQPINNMQTAFLPLQSVFGKNVELIQQKVKLENSLKNYGEFKIIKNIHTPNQQKGNSFIYNIVFSSILFVFLGVVFSILLDLRRKVKERNKLDLAR
ncbi:MAG: hypothetical protein H0X62_15360 [Bacteroidetes bacterium]|nr:hypothetical protein [Bacteroidota bacterium]